uniref:Integrase catalytic domain-containing protein n=1 Tax=Tanacetum cinerariifolium TaxID=118510 RepID=A0A6L2MRX0_TANCI|nr:hypothetical protein [Tanacetum cinerariifolium]
MVAEDNETSQDKEIDKLMALISLSFKKIYKPTNNNLRTSSNTSRANQDNSSRINRSAGYENQRIGNVAGAKETIGSMTKPKRAKDAAYHREKMLLCKQEEAGILLNAEPADWRDDTDDDELEDQELEAHYMYMEQLQEVSPDAADSGPIFDDEPLQKVSNDDHYNVFAMENEHPEQSVPDTYPIDQDAHNVIIDSLDMSYDREEIDQNDDDNDLANERELLASLIEKLECEIDENENRNKFLETDPFICHIKTSNQSLNPNIAYPGRVVRVVRTDKSTKFLNQTLHVYFATKGIQHQTSVARTPEQNGVVERGNRTLVEAARIMLSAAKVPLFFWAEAIATTMASVQISFDPAPECQTMVLEHDSLSPGLMEIRQVVTKSSAVSATDAPYQQPHAKNDQVADDEFINIFSTPMQDQGETSSRHVDSSNKHTFYQRYPSEQRWTMDHPLEQVIGNPSQSVRTRCQLESDAEMCMFALTVSRTEPKNIKEAMADSAWIELMQEELHQFDQLDVWELVDRPLCTNVINL